jgi:uncharacterized membrane protein (UPF0127 family)
VIEGRAQSPRFRVELARSEAERAQGLMFRRQLGALEGMLFFMPERRDWSFWMRNTYLALDMIFIDEDWRVAGVLANVPPLNEVSRRCGQPSRYVLELAAHEAERHGIRPGVRLRLVGLAAPGPARGARP